MKFFKRFIFPVIYGLLIYFTIRLLHDTDIGLKFWRRPLITNLAEISTAIVTGYSTIAVFRLLLKYFERSPFPIKYTTVIRELAIMILTNSFIVSALFLPVAALTDDGLSMDDVVDWTVIPTFFAIMYYSIVRGRALLKAYVAQKTTLEKITIDQLQTELKFLKGQYHPHFLFNALNTIYFQMDKDVESAKLSIEHFSELLRYQLYHKQQKVPIKQEIDYLKSFIEFQKIRKSRKLLLEITIDPALSGQLIYPLLFLPLIENAFKYVGGNYRINVSVQLEKNAIFFKVENSVSATIRYNEAGGIGLKNLKRRLELLYYNTHQIRFYSGNETFVAELKIPYEPEDTLHNY